MTDAASAVADHFYRDRVAFQRMHGIVGTSLEIREVVETIMQVAPTDITVLLTGESGTGKEVVAKAIHAASRRASKKFIPVNCGAIPEGILESELFGHEKGAFTGAVETRKGYFELADGGTIFLDEIGDTPLSTQVKLLRVLETGDFMRVGSAEPRRADVRIITATNKDLEEEVREKRFRQDLYFRLRSVNLRLPPLRERRVDIPLLTKMFLEESGENGEQLMLTEDAMEMLSSYSWPGNIRELRNLIESLAVLEHGNVVDEHMLRRYLHVDGKREDSRSLPVPLGKSPEQAERELIFRALLEIRTDVVSLRNLVEEMRSTAPGHIPVLHDESGAPMVSLEEHSLSEIEQMMIQHALERFEGNRRLAAQALDISERTLYRKIKEYGL